MLLEGEDSDEDFFQYKISEKDWEILQMAKAQQPPNPEAVQLGFQEQAENVEMMNFDIKSQPGHQLLLTPPKRKAKNKSPINTPNKGTRHAVKKLQEELKSQK